MSEYFCLKIMKHTLKLALGLAALAVTSSSFALTLQTNSGTQTIPDNPKRIVVLDYSFADNLIRLKETGRVVGLPTGTSTPTFINNAYKNAKPVGSLKEPDFEKIAELKPDLIVVSARTLDKKDELAKIAPVYVEGIETGKAYESIKRSALNVGKIVYNEAAAKKALADLDKRVAKVKAAAKGKNGLVVIANDRKLSAFGLNSRYSIVYEDFGFTVVEPALKAGTHGVEINYEYLLNKNPQYLFVVDRTAAVSTTKDNAKNTFSTPLLANTQAVKNNNVVYLDSAVWYLAFGGLTATETMVDEFEKALKLK